VMGSANITGRVNSTVPPPPPPAPENVGHGDDFASCFLWGFLMTCLGVLGVSYVALMFVVMVTRWGAAQ